MLSGRRVWPAATTAVALGARHALVSPTLIAAISDTASAVARAAVVGVYRFWRDSGYLVGGLVAVAISGLWVVHDLPGDAPARTLVESIAQRSSTGACS